MYTAKTTVQTGRKGIAARPLADKTRHQVLRADGGVLLSCQSLEAAEVVAKELNEFEANPPKFGDLDAEFIRICTQFDL